MKQVIKKNKTGFRFSILAVVCASVLAAIWLFNVSQSVQNAEKRLADLQRNVLREKKTLRVLRAEWDYLNRPARLEELSRTYLDLGAPRATQFSDDGADLPESASPDVPLRKPVAYDGGVR